MDSLNLVIALMQQSVDKAVSESVHLKKKIASTSGSTIRMELELGCLEGLSESMTDVINSIIVTAGAISGLADVAEGEEKNEGRNNG